MQALNTLHRIKNETLQWRLSHADDLAHLKLTQSLAEQERIAQLKKKSLQLAHELAILKARNGTELEMVKTQCRQDLKDYQQYLQALDQLKTSLLSSYRDLPEAVAYTIHHHAKQLLNELWEERDPQARLNTEMRLIRFMTAVHEDKQLILQDSSQAGVPRNTLALIEQGSNDYDNTAS